jgi:transcriptional regulator with XRE-family HTH domain
MNYLREFRVKKLMTQKELARVSCVSQTTIAYAESQVSEPTDFTKQKLARALKVEVEKIFPPRDRSVKP